MIDGVTLQYPKPYTPRYKIRILGFFLGAALASSIGAVSIWSTIPDSVVNRVAALSFPHDLRGSRLLFSSPAGTSVYEMRNGSFESLNLGTRSLTHFMAHQGPWLVSVQQSPDRTYEVRVNASMVYRSTLPILSASVSSDGQRVVVTELASATTTGGTSGSLPSTHVTYLEAGKAPRVLAEGFAPFFIDAGRIAWFTSVGLLTRDVSTTSAPVVLDAGTRPASLPYPFPAVSPNGSLIAWVDVATQTVTVNRIEGNHVVTVAEYPKVKSPQLALSNDALFMIEQHADTHTSTLWRYPLATGASPSEVQGLPIGGTTLMQFIP